MARGGGFKRAGEIPTQLPGVANPDTASPSEYRRGKRQRRGQSTRKPRAVQKLERIAAGISPARPEVEARTFLDSMAYIEAQAQLAMQPPPPGVKLLAWSRAQTDRLQAIRDTARVLGQLLEEEKGQRDALVRAQLDAWRPPAVTGRPRQPQDQLQPSRYHGGAAAG